MLSNRILTPYGYIWSETVFHAVVLAFSRKRRRDSTRIIYEILLASKNGVSKTKVVYASNLNFRLIEDYLSFLLRMKYLARTPSGTSHGELKLTEKGARLLGLLDQLEKEIKPFRALRIRREGSKRRVEGSWSTACDRRGLCISRGKGRAPKIFFSSDEILRGAR